jgi:hypothetical protein
LLVRVETNRPRAAIDVCVIGSLLAARRRSEDELSGELSDDDDDDSF